MPRPPRLVTFPPPAPVSNARFHEDTSQHGEVALLRKVIGPDFPTFLVDVGAHDGRRFSNSWSFTQEGWAAILVEPLPKAFARLQAAHRGNPRIECVNAACSDRRGSAALYFGIDGDEGMLSTLCLDDNNFFRQVRTARKATVRVETLTDLLAHYDCPSDFGLLLVDAEGMDHEVLAGLDFDRFRPRVVVTEEYLWNVTKHLDKYRLLSDRGYRLWSQVGCNTIWLQRDKATAPQSGRPSAPARSVPPPRDGTAKTRETAPLRFLLIQDSRSSKGPIGYFSLFLQILWWLERSDAEGYVPIVHTDNPDSLFHDATAPTPNQWEHFFHPVSEYSEADALDLEARGRASIVRRDDYGGPPYNRDVDEASRARFHDVLTAYVRPKDHLLEKVDSYWSREFGAQMLGVHIRHTDKPRELLFEVPLARYYRQIDRYLDEQPASQIFLATDDQRPLLGMVARYGERVHVNPGIYRSRDGEAVHLKHDLPPFKKAEDALIECLLMSRCDHLIRSASNVSHAALLFNCEMTHTFVRPTRRDAVSVGMRRTYHRGRRLGVRIARRYAPPLPRRVDAQKATMSATRADENTEHE